jgi:hypothetical protein
MQFSKFKPATLAVTIILILISCFSVNAFFDPYLGRKTIPSSGSIIFQQIQLPGSYKSEVREVAVTRTTMGGCDWDLIAQTVKNYNITTLAAPMLLNYLAYYPSEYVPHPETDELALAVEAAHSHGLDFRVSMAVLYKSPVDEWKIIAADGSARDWMDPTNPVARQHLENLVGELVTNYSFESLSFDYIRYDDNDVPYSETARQQLEEYLGENITDWPGEFAPEGSRYDEFMEWRIIPITTLVRDLSSLTRSIKPNIEIVANTMLWPYDQWRIRKTFGQDWVDWVNKRYIDRVNPMTYRTDLGLIQGVIDVYMDQGIAGPEGIVPLTPYLANYQDGEILSPEEIKAQVDLVRSLGVDGWAIAAYGGPGDNPDNIEPFPDIRDYLVILDLPEVFTMSDIEVNLNVDNVTITWITDKPTTSKVEYSTSTLFNASYKFEDPWFHYWDMDYYQGTVVENATSTMNHKIVLTGLQNGTLHHFRVQSQDSTGIATSKVYSFFFGSLT